MAERLLRPRDRKYGTGHIADPVFFVYGEAVLSCFRGAAVSVRFFASKALIRPFPVRQVYSFLSQNLTQRFMCHSDGIAGMRLS